MLRKNVPKMTPTSKMKYTEKCPNLNMPSKAIMKIRPSQLTSQKFKYTFVITAACVPTKKLATLLQIDKQSRDP